MSSQKSAGGFLSLVATCAVALGACGKGDESAKKAPDPAPKEVVTLPPSSDAVPAPEEATLKAHMREHFTWILDIQRAVVVGDLKKAKERAAGLAEHETASDLSSYSRELDSVRAAALVFSKVETLEAAAESSARLASRCGHCHLETSAITSFEWSEAPVADGTTKSAMQRHQWAMDRLWEGIVGPSNMSWQRGAELLSEEPLDKALPEVKGKSTKIAQLLAREEKLAKKARAASNLEQRARLYGELLGVCASCHRERDTEERKP